MWVDHKKLLPVIPRATLFEWMGERKVKIRAGGTGPNGKPVREVNILSLPLDLQAKALKLLRDDEGQAARTDVGLDLTTVPDHHLGRALDRIAACRQVIEAPRGQKTAAAEAAAERLGVSIKQLYRELARYKKAVKRGENILAAMLPKWRGPGRGKALPEDLIAWVKAEYLKPTRPSAAKVHRALDAECKKKGIPTPSYPTVRRLVADIPRAAKVRHRKGREAYRKTAMPKVRRDYTTLAPLELICGDHHPLDIFATWRGKTIRPWITVWMDMRTRSILGRAYSPAHPNSWSIARALRHAILPKPEGEAWPMCGVPRRTYVDNGKDYLSHHLKGRGKTFRFELNKETRGVLADLGVGVEWARDPDEEHKKRNIHARPYSPWSKTAERWFGTLERDAIQDLVGWCGHKPEARPEKLAGELKAGKLLSFSEFCEAADRWIVEEYHQRAHRGQGMEGRSPQQAWEGLDKEIRLPRERTLDLLLMKVEGRTIHTSGITLGGYWYWDECLALHVGERVTVRYSPEEMGRVIVFRSGEFLCEAHERKLYGFDATAEDLKAIQAEQKRATRVVTEYRDLMVAQVAQPDPVERHFAEREVEEKKTRRQAARQKHVDLITRLDTAAKKLDEAPGKRKSKLAAWPHELEAESA